MFFSRTYALANPSLNLTALIVIFDPDDIVLAQITSGLNLDQFQRNLAGIFHPMGRSDWDIDRFVLVHDLDEFIDGHARRATHHDPVLGPMMMFLQREPAAWLHHDALDLMPLAHVDRLIRAPRPMNLEMFFCNLRGDRFQSRD